MEAFIVASYLKILTPLELYWSSELNDGTLDEIKVSLDGEYYWRSFANSTLLKMSLNDFLRILEYHNGVDYNLPYKGKKLDLAMVSSFISNKYWDLVDLIEFDDITYHFYAYKCKICKSYHYGTFKEITSILKQGNTGLICRDCLALVKALKRRGSLYDFKPEILPYYTKNNKLPLHMQPACRQVREKDVKIELKCPRCGRIFKKRNDTVLKTGALCNQCATTLTRMSTGDVQSLRSVYPVIADMFDKGGNELTSDEVPCSSSCRKYNFYCDGSARGLKPHIFTQFLYNVIKAFKTDTSFKGCPICSGFELRTGINDFKTLNPRGASMWDYSKNNKSPDQVYAYDSKQYYFICSKGHPFRRDLIHMMRSIGTYSEGCPVCHGKQIVKGMNDLATVIPKTLEQWDYDLNDFTPYDVTEKSNRKMYARCQVDTCDNIFETTVYNWSHNLVRRCPDCRNSQISTDEMNLLNQIYNWGCAVSSQKLIDFDKYSIDIYLHNTGIGVEYNGLYWHSSIRREADYHKNKYLASKKWGIDLYFVWEDDYNFKRELTLNLLKQKLFDIDSIYNPSDCELSFVDRDTAKFIIDNYSLIPFNLYSSFTGEYEYVQISIGDEIAAIFQLKEIDYDTIEVYGYCEKFIVPNRWSLIKEFISLQTGYTKVRVSHALGEIWDLLPKKGKCVEILEPKKCYIVGERRVFILDENSGIAYFDNMSELQLATYNSLKELYNAGYEVWEEELS